MKKSVILAVALIALSAWHTKATYGQQPVDPTPAKPALPAVATTPQPSFAMVMLNWAMEYATTNHNFVATGGPGGSIKSLRNGKFAPVVAESLTIFDNGSTNYNLKLDFALATCIADNKTHEGIGFDVRYIGGLPRSWKVKLPILGRLGTFHTIAGVAEDADHLFKGRFDQTSTVCWAGFGLGGE